MQNFKYFIPKLEHPKKGLLKTFISEFNKYSTLKKSTFVTFIILLFAQISPWAYIGSAPIYSTSGIVSFVGILIFFFCLASITFFFIELFGMKIKANSESVCKIYLFSGFQLFLLCSIGFSIVNNLKSLTSEATPQIGAFVSLVISLVLFIETVLLLANEKPIKTTTSNYLISEDTIEKSLDEYLESRISESAKNEELLPSKEQTRLFDIEE